MLKTLESFPILRIPQASCFFYTSASTILGGYGSLMVFFYSLCGLVPIKVEPCWSFLPDGTKNLSKYSGLRKSLCFTSYLFVKVCLLDNTPCGVTGFRQKIEVQNHMHLYSINFIELH